MARAELYDLIVVGGSFAGLACVRTAATRGLKVAVIDGKPEPGARVRTTGIVVKEASDDFDLPARLMRKVRGVRLAAPDGRAVELSAPGYFFQATDTAELLRFMAEEARRAGATLLFGRKFEDASEASDRIDLKGLGLAARTLIGADGARSKVAEVFGLGRNSRFLVGLEVHTEPLSGVDPRFLHCFADRRIAPGYIGWAVQGVGVTQLGAAATFGRKPDLGRLIERARAEFGFAHARVVERRSGLIPSGGPVAPLGRGRVLLIGDAAGLVSPATGGGIHSAMHFGRRAAQFVSDYLLDRGPHPAAALAAEVPRYRSKLLLRRALDLPVPNFAINALLMTAPMRALAQRIYFHRRRGDGSSFEAWTAAFAEDDMTPTAESRPPEMRCV
jgi:flavin-dependent dehydrogenase